tara:strand:+ start:615 stop:806 length:192 start_codon:yes stop_codon:yes gene_type:complete
VLLGRTPSEAGFPSNILSLLAAAVGETARAGIEAGVAEQGVIVAPESAKILAADYLLNHIFWQ